MIRYGVWYDDQEGDYSIIRWDDRSVSIDPRVRGGKVVQTGIRTEGKAQIALRVWRQREVGKDVP
jgi:hypothetical protein